MTVTERIREQQSELVTLCKRHRVKRLELFGSATRADFDARRSDLDFLVEFDQFPAGAYADAYFGLLESLEQLFQRPVDLVVASAIKNPYFRQAVERTKTLLYAA